jgi:hypothetical protein
MTYNVPCKRLEDLDETSQSESDSSSVSSESEVKKSEEKNNAECPSLSFKFGGPESSPNNNNNMLTPAV